LQHPQGGVGQPLDVEQRFDQAGRARLDHFADGLDVRVRHDGRAGQAVQQRPG
jgi:hypothetical protein